MHTNKRPFHKIDIMEFEELEDQAWEFDKSHSKEKLASHSYDESEYHSQDKAWREARQNGRGKLWQIEGD